MAQWFILYKQIKWAPFSPGFWQSPGLIKPPISPCFFLCTSIMAFALEVAQHFSRTTSKWRRGQHGRLWAPVRLRIRSSPYFPYWEKKENSFQKGQTTGPLRQRWLSGPAGRTLYIWRNISLRELNSSLTLANAYQLSWGTSSDIPSPRSSVPNMYVGSF